MANRPYELVVPPAADAPHGVLVWVDPSDSGAIPVEGWRDVLARRGLIWVGLNGCGNGAHGTHRYGSLFQAVGEVAGSIRIQWERVYAAGFSGGAKVASIAAMCHPEVIV